MSRTRLNLIASAVLLSISLGAAAQQTYRWTDKNGKVHYSDKAPTEQQPSLQQRAVGSSAVDTSALDYGTQQAAKNFPVSLYTAPGCIDACAQARDLLQKRGVPFSEVSVNDDKVRTQLKLASGDTQVPVLIVGRDVSRGFESGMFHAALDNAGYPKSASAPRAQRAAGAAQADAKAAEPKQPRGRYSPPQ